MESDGSIEESTEPPTGSVLLPNKIVFDQQTEAATSEAGYTEEGISKTNFVLNIKKSKPVDISSIYPAKKINSENLHAKVKFQSETDATLHYLNSESLTGAIEATVKRMYYLFGDDISE